MSDMHEVILIDEQKSSKETLSVSTVGSYEFENTELTGLWVDSDTGKLEIYTKALPQLTIPKSVAESKWMKHLLSCDLSQFEFERFDEFLNKEDEQFLKWVNTDKNENILYIFLAGKALGVDLVKVVEG